MRLEGGAAAGKERDLNQNDEQMNDRSNKQWKRGDRWKKRENHHRCCLSDWKKQSCTLQTESDED